ncbi:MAG: hypothetical protein FJ292_00420 [Planctomycetes bacterium]|nr:hypothetical protein [Planctomycetota bacterium]
MSTDTGRPEATGTRVSFAGVAAKGSLINSTQWLINKGATAIAMLIVARFLEPEDYGVANQAIAIMSFMVFFFPLTMGDVLISHHRQFDELAPTAGRLAVGFGIFTSLSVFALIPVFLSVYPDWPPFWFGLLLAIAACRPALDALLMMPLTRLRIELKYGRIAIVDGLVQIGATVASLGMAVVGWRGVSLVAPQILGSLGRVLCYRRTVPVAMGGSFDRGAARRLLGAYLPAASAQYLHNILVMLELLVLGLAAGDYQTGLFAFAFQVAAQANTVVAYQLGVVLQPILGHLQDDRARQVAGFFRVQRVLGMICVPISLLQAVIAEPLFRIAFPERFSPAVPVFQVISLAQAVYFATGPSMSCLRAQRRFGTFLAWQSIQFLVSVPIYLLAADRGGALGVSIASALVWSASAPIAVWLCARVTPGPHLRETALVFLKPWLAGAPVFYGAWLLIGDLGTRGPLGDWGAVCLVGPGAALITMGALALFDRDMRRIAVKVGTFIRDRAMRSRRAPMS